MAIDRKKLRRLLIWVALLLIVLLGILVWLYQKSLTAAGEAELEAAAKQVDRTFVLKRGELVLGVNLPGTVSASKKHRVVPEANIRTTIVWIIEENSRIRKGDVLVRLDGTELENRIADGRIELENLEKEQALALEAQRLEDSTQAANHKAAEDRVIKADDSRRKYLRFERRQKRESLDLAIETARNKVDAAKDTYRNYKNNPETDSDEEKQKAYKKKLTDAQTAISNAENELINAENARRVWKLYDDPSKIKALDNEVDQAALNMEKVKVAIESSRARTRRQLNNYRLRIRRVSENLKQNEDFLAKMTIAAPADGIVIYGNPDRPGSNPDIKPGMEVWRGMILMTIPEMSNMIVNVDLPEQFRSKVKVGDRVIVSPDALPALKFYGEVEEIPTLPVNVIFWDSGSPKVYKSRVKFDKQSDLLVNGMSVQIEIVTNTLKDVLFVPVEAIFEDKERFFVYVQEPQGGSREADVVIGESNARFVEIKEGLRENDVIYLYRPYEGRTGQ